MLQVCNTVSEVFRKFNCLIKCLHFLNYVFYFTLHHYTQLILPHTHNKDNSEYL